MPAPTVSDVSDVSDPPMVDVVAPMVDVVAPVAHVVAPVADVVANIAAPVIPPVRKKRPTKVVVPKEPDSKEPKEPVKAKVPKAPKEPKEPKAPKASKKTKPEQEIPLLHKEVTLPTHQEMDMEEYSAEGFHIEYVTLSVFTHDGTTYFRDKRKNKLYQYGGPRRVGTYVGRYHPGREEIFTDLPDSDEES